MMKCRLLTLPKEAGYRFEALADKLPEIKLLTGVEQNPQWHREGDVYTHTRLVCAALLRLPEWKDLNDKEKGILYLAAYFHDIGKYIRTRNVEGTIVSPGHTMAGSRLFRELCYKKYDPDFPHTFAEREAIAYLVRYHGLPPLFMEKTPLDLHLIRARESVDFKLLYLLAKADILGRESDGQEEMLNQVEYFKEYAMELGCFESPYSFANPYSRYQYLRAGSIWPGSQLYDDTRFPVYIMAGLPLSGKDTYIKNNLAGAAEVSLDAIRAELGIGPADGSARIAAEARELAKSYLRKEQPFVWNATNIIKDTRQKICRLCENYGARVKLIYIEAPYQELLHRNQIRERTVPVPVIDRMLKKLDMPEAFEAYEIVYYVGGK